MNCPTETYRDRRVVHSLRPTPIVAHKIAPESYRFLGLHWGTWLIMSGIAGAGWLAGLPL